MILALASVAALVLTLPIGAVVFGYTMRALWTGVRLPPPAPGSPTDRALRQATAAAFKEWMSTLVVLVTWPLGLVNSRSSGDPPPLPARPLLILPGYGLTRASTWSLQRWLAKEGVAAVSSWTPPLFSTPRRAAARLVSRLRAISQGASDRPVDVVAFGASGLLLGEALAADSECPLGRLVTLGTAHRGSPMAIFLPGPGAPALLPDRPDLVYWRELLTTTLSHPLPRLPDGSEPPDAHDPRWVSIRSADDPWVPPPCGEAPDGALEAVLHGAGHLHLLHSARARTAVLTALRSPRAAGTLSEPPEAERAP